MVDIDPDVRDVIVRKYKTNFLEPLLGDCEVSTKLQQGLYDVLSEDYPLSMPVRDAFTKKFCLYVRAMGAFRILGAKTLGDVTKLTENDILQFKNAGEGTVKYIQEELKKYGLGLKD